MSFSSDHDRALSDAFDGQASQFERAPVQTDPMALDRLVRHSGFPAGSRVLDAGCGPGLVSAALLQAGYRVVGVDLSREMIDRARARCEGQPGAAEFHQASLHDANLDGLAPFDGALSRYVLHHVPDPMAFVRRQVSLLRPGGILVLNDHLTDPDRELAGRHEAIERARDGTHTRNLTGGGLVDLLARAGLERIHYLEEPFVLDFDEWFDRGTPELPKARVREMILDGPPIRGFAPSLLDDGSIRIECVRGFVKGVKPARA
ncbi:Ubiquinone biosynthesis O-methyltransferase [Aquisphaera giovannonii]|uniref:Ubiquinone biosynthesis O-methyltransferase n=1 Tax=Aquisphaera giovannonii TaxID=406548 RepID=A0A5B9VXS1_9BACT|nr:class I SAM-dependent methyltransferase [Aquisphaera giovannonii]QEH33088.1 Ubiquinone biosynthesis O-methyltransferase [Aquisphaera giovannonii]